jgi:hypothetical protein
MFRSKVLPEIESLDAVKDHQRITFLSCRMDFPWDTTRALEFALFRTFCVPSISALLDSTQEFALRAQKRYDDTDIIVSTLMERGYDSEYGRAALKRMNAIHGRFDIANEDFLYVLSTFIFVPDRWNERFGWRRMTEKERIAIFHFWREVGIRMNIKNIPAELAAFEKYSADYEREHYRFTETNHRVGLATRDLFKSWFPRWMRPFVKKGIYAAMDEPLLKAFGFPKPSPFMRRFVENSLKFRARALRLLPHRRQPVLRTEMKPRSYPDGYKIDEVGPPGATGKDGGHPQ